MAERNLHKSTVGAAAEYLGGYSTLALILNVSVDELERWASGTASPPANLVPRLMDLVSEDLQGPP
jgi:hypothetical protein